MRDHPLAAMLAEAALGRFPPVAAAVEVLPSPPGPADAVVSFTGHEIVAADVGASTVLSRLEPGDLGASMRAPFLCWLGAHLDAEVAAEDVVLAVLGDPEAPGPALERHDHLSTHPRVARAVRYRDDIAVYAEPGSGAIVVIGSGLAGRREVGIELDPDERSRGLGRALATAARRLVPPGTPLFAQVAPGNAASLRAFLAAGYVPIGSEVLLLPRPG